MNSNSRIISTDEDPSLRIESSAIINLRGVSTSLTSILYSPCNRTRNLELKVLTKIFTQVKVKVLPENFTLVKGKLLPENFT